MTLYDEIQGRLEKCGQQALITAGERTVSAIQLAELAEQIRQQFHAAGICEFRKVALLAPDSPEYIAVALGIIGAGGVLVSAGHDSPEPELNRLLDELEIDFLVRENNSRKTTPPAFEPLKLTAIGTVEYQIFRRRNKSEINAEFAKLNPTFIRFSSGTTGQSKGVVLSENAIRARTDAVQKKLALQTGERILWRLPMAYHFAVTIIMFLRQGCIIELMPQANGEEILERLRTPDTAMLYASPYHYAELTAAKKITPAEMPRLIISTAMALNQKTAANFANRFQRQIQQAYGVIECGLPCINLDPNPDDVISVGSPLPGYEIKLEFSSEFPEDSGVGEVLIRGNGLFDAYCSPWQTRQEASGNGWFHSGDMGYFRQAAKSGNKKLFLSGRQKNVINFLGMKVFPEQVEQALLELPEIAEARVYGKLHPGTGELVIAEIVPARADMKIDQANVIANCRQRLSPHEIPQQIINVKAVPKTRSGKLLRHDSGMLNQRQVN